MKRWSRPAAGWPSADSEGESEVMRSDASRKEPGGCARPLASCHQPTGFWTYFVTVTSSDLLYGLSSRSFEQDLQHFADRRISADDFSQRQVDLDPIAIAAPSLAFEHVAR
jgi:hypothetical protein